MYEKLVFFAQRIVREMELAKKILDKVFQNKAKKQEIFRELNEVFIRAKDFKKEIKKEPVKIKGINQIVKDAKKLRRYVRDILETELRDTPHYDEMVKRMNEIESKIKSIRDTAEKADEKKKTVSKFAYV